ncbi:RDD family protein [Pedobacter duraquae]|uniref:Putative RDD family membrane protein YckC n=1 Tax=Pedobacter duraquae TaxID=425511 RepID=A0A4R6IM48_9SPHI|nr:RDD family protein [Pedobacter duraquae]TDO23234.1 putative RDD family membrane protein YckC [Pedobacter duraquae]
MSTLQQADYTVVINGKPQGPFQLAELATLNIKPGTFIRKPGMADYKEAHEFSELRELLGFTFQQTAPQYFASFDQRLLASAIDFFVITLLYIFVVLISFIFLTDKTQRIITAVALLPLIPVVKFVYGVFAEASAAQATLGKRLLAIKVTDLGGSRIDIPTSLGRNAAKIISVFPLFFGYLYSFLNRKQQCWHDIIANTLVIKDRLI